VAGRPGLHVALREARVARGLSQGALGALAGLSRQSVQAIESGSSVPSVEAALKLAAALDRPIDQLFALAAQAEPETLVIAGSDDPALERLVDALRDRGGPLVSLSRLGSRDGLQGLRAGRADLASVHVVDVRAVVGAMPLARIAFARREQGLVFDRRQPFRDLPDVVKKKARFAARNEGSGTRALLDDELTHAGITPEKLRGYDTRHARHADVVAAILSGDADVGIALRADANRFGLGFAPLRWEELSLVGRPEVVRSARTAALRSALRDRHFREAIEALGGYDLSAAGRIEAVPA